MQICVAFPEVVPTSVQSAEFPCSWRDIVTFSVLWGRECYGSFRLCSRLW